MSTTLQLSNSITFHKLHSNTGTQQVSDFVINQISNSTTLQVSYSETQQLGNKVIKQLRNSLTKKRAKSHKSFSKIKDDKCFLERKGVTRLHLYCLEILFIVRPCGHKK